MNSDLVDPLDYSGSGGEGLGAKKSADYSVRVMHAM